MKNGQQSQHLLLKVDPRSTSRNNFLQLALNVLLQDKLITKVKSAKHRANCQRNNVARKVEGFVSRISPLAEQLLRLP